MIISNRILTHGIMILLRLRYFIFYFAFELYFPYLNIELGYNKANGDSLRWFCVTPPLYGHSRLKISPLSKLTLNNRTIILNRMLKLVIDTHSQNYYSNMNYY